MSYRYFKNTQDGTICSACTDLTLERGSMFLSPWVEIGPDEYGRLETLYRQQARKAATIQPEPASACPALDIAAAAGIAGVMYVLGTIAALVAGEWVTAVVCASAAYWCKTCHDVAKGSV